MNDLEQQYLQAAYDFAKSDSLYSFYEDDITNYVDLDFSEPGSRERFIGLTQSLLKKGLIAPESKGFGIGRRTLQLTSKGLEEAEKLSDPIEQKKVQRKKFLRAIYDLSDGNPAQYVRWQNLASRIGLQADIDAHLDRAIALAEYAEKAGHIVIEDNDGTEYRITDKGVDEVEGNAPQPQQNYSSTINVSGGNFYQPAIGNHNTNSFVSQLNFLEVEDRIESECGEDKEQVRELVSKMRELLERGDTADKGFLSRWNDKLKKYDWLANAVAGWLLSFSTQL